MVSKSFPGRRLPWQMLLLLLTSKQGGNAQKTYDTEYTLSRSCFVDESQGMSKSSKKITEVVQFTYSVETDTRRTGTFADQETDYKFLDPLQELILDSATDASIGCSRQQRRALSHSMEVTRNLESLRERSVDAVMRSFLAPTDSEGEQNKENDSSYCNLSTRWSECTVFNAVLRLTVDDHAIESSMAQQVLTRLKRDMEDDRYVNPSIPGIMAVTYHGPDPATAGDTFARRSTESILWISVKATVLVLLVGGLYGYMTVLWHKKGPGLESTTEPTALLKEDMVYEQEEKPIAIINETPGGGNNRRSATSALHRISFRFNRNRANTPGDDSEDEMMMYDDYNSDSSSASENTVHRSNKSIGASAASGLGETQVHPMDMSESFLVHLT